MRLTHDHTKVFAADGETVRLLSLATGKELKRFEGHEDDINAIDLSSDEKYLVTGGADKTARLWDVSTVREVRRFLGHGESIHGVALSPNGEWLATSSDDGIARIWDLQSGRELNLLKPQTDETSGAEMGLVRFSHDSKTVLVSVKDPFGARLWVPESGRDVALTTTSFPTDDVALSEDGRWLLFSTDHFQDPGVEHLWDVAAGREDKRGTKLELPDGDDKSQKPEDFNTGLRFVRPEKSGDGSQAGGRFLRALATVGDVVIREYSEAEQRQESARKAAQARSIGAAFVRSSFGNPKYQYRRPCKRCNQLSPLRMNTDSDVVRIS